MHVRILREFYPGDRVLLKDLRKEDTWWPGSVAERSGPRTYVVVLDDKRVWKRHVDHVRRDSMDRAVTVPSREMEAQDKPPDNQIAIPLSVCVPDPAPAPSVRPANVRSGMESGEAGTGGSPSHCSRQGSTDCHTISRSGLPPISPIF